MRVFTVVVFTALIIVVAQTPSLAGLKTCLVGTDPSVANDVSQITAVRQQIDTQCPCVSFDGSPGKTHGGYVMCATKIIKAQSAASNLRTQCKRTVTAYYKNSTCGRNPILHPEPCIQTNVRTGKITCAIKATTKSNGITPTTSCTTTATTSRVACYAYTTCIDAADTNGDGLIDAGDSGACVQPPKVIFVTSETIYVGSNPLGLLQYPSRGDAICQAAAAEAPALAGKTFRALICGREPGVGNGDYQGIRARSTDSPSGYVRTDGARIASDLNDLLDGNLDNPISFDQFGQLLHDIQVNDISPVWTGCSASGSSYGVDLQCSGPGISSWWFYSSMAFGEIGWPDRTDQGWIDGGTSSCQWPRHLYCIEQSDTPTQTPTSTPSFTATATATDSRIPTLPTPTPSPSNTPSSSPTSPTQNPAILLAPDPLSVHPGSTRELTVTIPQIAPAGGANISLMSANSTVATVTASLTIPEGQTSAVAIVSGGNLGATTVTAISPGYFSATAAIHVEYGSIILRLIDTPLVGVGRDATLEVELVQPQPGGPVVVVLTVDDPSLVYAPSSVDFPAGQDKVRTTIHGLAAGSTVIRATAPGFNPGELDIRGELQVGITTRLVILSLDDTLSPREDLPIPVLLSLPAPGGTAVTLETVETSVVTVNTATVPMAAGQTAALGSLRGVRAGVTQLKGSAPNYASDITDVRVSAELRASPSPFHALSGVPNVMTITYYHDGLPRVAPTGGIDVALVIADPNCITIDSSIKTILEGQVSTTVTVTGIPPAQCSTRITATSAETGSVDFDVLPAGPLVLSGFYQGTSIGAGLQTAAYYGITLGAPAPPGGVTVHLASQDPSQVLVAGDPTLAGTPSIDLFVAEGGTQTAGFYVDAMPGAPLNVGTTLQATAPGYQSASSPVLTVVTPTYFTLDLASTVHAGATDPFYVCAAAPAGGGHFFAQSAAGGAPLSLTVQSSASLVGEVRTSSVSGGSVSVAIPAGQVCTPYDLPSGGIGFRGVSTGTTSVSSTGGGLVPCESLIGGGSCSVYWGYNVYSVTGVASVTVDVAPLIFSGFYQGTSIGAGLQTAAYYGITLGAPAPPGGVTVHLASQDPSQVRVAGDPTLAGAPSIDLFVAEGGTQTAGFYVDALSGAPLNVGTTLQATAPGYQTTSSAVLKVVTPTYFTLDLASTVYVGATDPFEICAAAYIGGSGFMAQSVAGGGPLALTVRSSAPLVGGVQTSSAFGGSVSVAIPAGQVCTPYDLSSGGVGFRGLSTSTTSVSIGEGGLVPCESLIGGGNCSVSWGYNAYSVTGVVSVTVDVPPLVFGGFNQGTSIGAGLQTASYYGITLRAPAPPGGVTVHLASQDPSQVLVAGDSTVAGSPSMDLFVAEGGTQTAAFYVYAVHGAPLNVGTTLQATAPGYQSASSEVLKVVTPTYFTFDLASAAHVGATDPFEVCTAAPIGGSGFIPQSVAGGGSLALTVQSSAPLVGQVQTSSASGGFVSVAIPAGQVCTPYDLSSGGVGFRGLSTGTTSVSSSGGGLIPCESLIGGGTCSVYWGYNVYSVTGVAGMHVQ